MINKNSIASESIINKIIENYNNGYYIDTIKMVSNYYRFENQSEIEQYLKDNADNLEDDQITKLREILYDWNDYKNLLNISRIYNKKENILIYKKYYSNSMEFEKALNKKIMKSVLSKNQLNQLNELLSKNLKNLENLDRIITQFNNSIDYVSTMKIIKKFFDTYINFETTIDDFKSILSCYDKGLLRDFAHIYKYIENLPDINSSTVQYGILKILLNMYKYLSEDIAFNYINDKHKILNEFKFNEYLNDHEMQCLRKIFQEYETKYLSKKSSINDNLSIYSYPYAVHVILNVLEIEALSDMKIYEVLKFDYKYSPSFLQQCLKSTHVVRWFKPEFLKKVNKIIEGYKVNIGNIIEQKKIDNEFQNIDQYKKMLNQFLTGNYKDITDYCTNNDLNINDFKKAITIIEKYDKDLYNRYKQYQENRQTNQYAILLGVCDKVLERLKNDKSFDILEYFKITKLSFNEISKFLINKKDSYSIEDVKIFKKFVQKNNLTKRLNNKDIKVLYNMEYSFLIKNADGTTKQVFANLEDKKNVINYLHNNDIPLYSKTYVVALRKYMNNELIISDSKLEKNKIF